MVSVQTLGMMLTDPQRGRVAVHALREVIQLPSDADAIGVGSCVDGAVLLRRTPQLNDGAVLDDFVELKSRCAVVQVRREQDLRPKIKAPANVGPFRWKQLAFAAALGPSEVDGAVSLRDAYLDELPDFLRRSIEGQTEAEAFFFATLAILHERGQLSGPRINSDELAQAALACIAQKSDEVPRHVVFGTGTEIVHVSHRAPICIARIEGIDLDVAEALEPTLVDSSMGRERLRRFRGTFVVGATAASDDGSAFARVLPEGGALIVGRDLDPREV